MILTGLGLAQKLNLKKKRIVAEAFSRADVKLDGRRSWDIRIHDERFYRRVFKGSLGLGESFVDADWDCQNIPELFRRILNSGMHKSRLASSADWLLNLKSRFINLQSRKRAVAVAEQHYDLNHRLYELFLGPWNQYTCCFFDGTDDLEQAEVNKLEMISDKLDIRPGDRVLDIGCGWGGFAKYAATTRGCHVTGITLSTEQHKYACNYTSGLEVEVFCADYRDLPQMFSSGSFDKVLICGMIEHVGCRSYRSIMKIVATLLKNNGLFLLHTIGTDCSMKVCDAWIEKYIFPNSVTPSMSQLALATQGVFTIQDWENYGQYYAKTLQAWHDNFEKNWTQIQAIKTDKTFDERFRRMFKYYFLVCKSGFLAERMLLWQIVMTKQGHHPKIFDRVNLRSTVNQARCR